MAQKKFKFFKGTVDVINKDLAMKNNGKGGWYYDWIKEPEERIKKAISLWHGTPN